MLPSSGLVKPQHIAFLGRIYKGCHWRRSYTKLPKRWGLPFFRPLFLPLTVLDLSFYKGELLNCRKIRDLCHYMVSNLITRGLFSRACQCRGSYMSICHLREILWAYDMWLWLLLTDENSNYLLMIEKSRHLWSLLRDLVSVVAWRRCCDDRSPLDVATMHMSSMTDN